jgi:hypothetical protein
MKEFLVVRLLMDIMTGPGRWWFFGILIVVMVLTVVISSIADNRKKPEASAGAAWHPSDITEHGIRPAPGERSMTKEEWKASNRAARASGHESIKR